MTFNINTILQQLESLEDFLCGLNEYQLCIDGKRRLCIQNTACNVSRQVHSNDMKRLFEIHYSNVGESFGDMCLVRWDDIGIFRQDIQTIYTDIYKNFPEKLI